MDSVHPLQIVKSRMSDACPLVDLMPYDLRRARYGKHYMLGRPSPGRDKITYLEDPTKYPRWATHARAPEIK